MNRGGKVHAKCANHVAAISHATKVEAAEKDPKVAQDAIKTVWALGHGLSGDGREK